MQVMKPHLRNTNPRTQDHPKLSHTHVMSYELLLLITQKRTLPSSFNSLGCFGTGTAHEDKGLLPFLEDVDLFAVFAAPAPTIKSITNIKGITSQYIPYCYLISRFSRLWKNREIKDLRIKIPARFKQAKFNTHTKN